MIILQKSLKYCLICKFKLQITQRRINFCKQAKVTTCGFQLLLNAEFLMNHLGVFADTIVWKNKQQHERSIYNRVMANNRRHKAWCNVQQYEKWTQCKQWELMIKISCSFQLLFIDLRAKEKKSSRSKTINIHFYITIMVYFKNILAAVKYPHSSISVQYISHNKCKWKHCYVCFSNLARYVACSRWMSQFIPREKTPYVWKLEHNLREYGSFTQTCRKMPKWQAEIAAEWTVVTNETHHIRI